MHKLEQLEVSVMKHLNILGFKMDLILCTMFVISKTFREHRAAAYKQDLFYQY